MGPCMRLNLDELPWPVNVLTFNRAIDGMQPGDIIMATIADAHVVDNLKRILGSLPDLFFDVVQKKRGYHIQVIRK
ncbi:hypothetical protein [Desulfosarcina ovata]|nr:hypothetical protein [Desulfosarcina ovata]